MDKAVSWPSCLDRDACAADGRSEFISAFFASMNRETLADVAPVSAASSALRTFFGQPVPPPLLRGWPVISFSHFLPHPALHRGYAWLQHFEGSHPLGDQVAALHADGASGVHVFGHTHFSMDRTVNGIRYIQQPLGNPHERQNGWQIHIGDFARRTGALAVAWSSERAVSCIRVS